MNLISFDLPSYHSSISSFHFTSLPGCLLFGDRPGTCHPRGPLAPRQKGGRRPQASRSQPKRQRLQVPLDLDRESYPPSCQILQDEAADCPDIQVRFGDCFDVDCLRGMELWSNVGWSRRLCVALYSCLELFGVCRCMSHAICLFLV